MKYYLKYILQKLIALLLLPFHLFPVKKNRVLFLSLEGGSFYEYSCNPKYFCEYLQAARPGDYELIWLFKEPTNYSFLREKGIRTARHFSPAGLYYALTSRIVITNGGYLTWFPFRQKQVCINTWHGGGAYKRLENDTTGANAATKKRMEYAARHTAAFLSGCEAFSRHVVRGAFLYTGKILPIGTPRNDILFSGQCDILYRNVRESLRLPATGRILLYAPTFRSTTGSHGQPLNGGLLIQELNRLTGETWYLLYRMHVQAGSEPPLQSLDSHCMDVSAYPDTQQLLCAADWLITDYSSIVWDYALTDRPLILYAPDLESYRSGRGFYVDIRDWGFPLCRTEEELLAMLPEVLSGAYKNGPKLHRELLGSYESGHSCKELLAFIEKQVS